jgi:hypothetical protein
MKTKMILTAILGMTACGAAFVGGNLKAMRKTRKSQEQLSNANEEIHRLKDLQRGVR